MFFSLLSSTSLRVFVFRQPCWKRERERERERRRAKTLLKLLSRDYTHVVILWIVSQATEIFDSSTGNSKNSSTFKPSKPSRLRPSTDSGLLSFPGSWGAFNGSKNRPPADIVVFEYPRLLQRSYFVVTATFSGETRGNFHSEEKRQPFILARRTCLNKHW